LQVASCRLQAINFGMRYILPFVLFLLPFASQALEITGFQADETEHGEHISIHLSGRTEYDVFMADSPPARLVVDLPPAHWHGKVALPKNYEGIIEDLHFSTHDAKTSRLVLNLPEGTEFDDLKLVHKKQYYGLEFDLTGRRKSRGFSFWKSSGSEKHEKARAKKSAKPVIVIDAGHGGQDSGTSGFNGSKEKKLTLHFAGELKESLQRTGRYRVVLTRTDDTYLLLGERVKRARAAHGDLFISIHADSSPIASARGLSVYTISGKASDKQSAALAEKENKADIIGGMDLSDTSKDVADILIDLTQRETRAKSCKFADLLVKNFRHEVTLVHHTHRFAGFAVLKAPDIPSVLIEVGFLSNQREEQLLKSASYQAKFLHGVVGAVDSYFANYTNLY